MWPGAARHEADIPRSESGARVSSWEAPSLRVPVDSYSTRSGAQMPGITSWTP